MKNEFNRRARKLAGRAFASGRITKPAHCAECGGDGQLSMHHKDYSKPLEVQWLCFPCHMRAHGCGSGQFTSVVMWRVPAKTKHALRILAVAKGKKISVLVREAIEKLIEAEGEKAAA